MTSMVKGVFKVLLAVPVIIAVVFLIFNLFSLATSYFRLLGLSYAVQNVAMENNYIPDTEYGQLTNHFQSLETAILRNVRFTDENEARTRRQYGETINIGVEAEYVWAIPFLPKAAQGKENASGQELFTNGPNTEYAQNPTGATAIDNGLTTTIRIEYSVPGMAYYPDMDN